MDHKLITLLGSRKFWAALIGLALIILKTYSPGFPISEGELTNLIYVLIAYILGTAIEDHGVAASSANQDLTGGSSNATN
jgi:hypothetical protein